jgi:hypothetical protein
MLNTENVINVLLKFEEARPTSVRHLIIRVVFVIHHLGFVMHWPTPPWWNHQDSEAPQQCFLRDALPLKFRGSAT